MKLVAMEANLQPGTMDRAVAAFEAQAPAVRAMEGCGDYALYRDPARDRIVVVQSWDSLTLFDAYRASDTFAALGAGLRPLMAGAPRTRIAELDG